jgi:CMP-N-acetylneuraminic acid synthetase
MTSLGDSKQFRVLGLVPARGGSKGIPGKNIKLLAGKPLLQYTAEAALCARSLSVVILSTEDWAIAEVGRNCGLRVPFIRPPELARDDTPTLPVVQHAVRWMEDRGETFDAVCLLQPTNPLRRSEDIDACVHMLKENDLDSVVSVLMVPAEHNPHWVYFQQLDGTLRLSSGDLDPIPRRQSLPPAYCREGSIYATRTEVIACGSLYGSRIGGYLIDSGRAVNLDEPEDWEKVEKLVSGLMN